MSHLQEEFEEFSKQILRGADDELLKTVAFGFWAGAFAALATLSENGVNEASHRALFDEAAKWHRMKIGDIKKNIIARNREN